MMRIFQNEYAFLYEGKQRKAHSHPVGETSIPNIRDRYCSGLPDPPFFGGARIRNVYASLLIKLALLIPKN